MSEQRDEPDLARGAARGAASTLSGQAVRFVVQLASIVLLARLLSPDDFGVVAIVAAVIGFGEVVRDFGLFNAAIRDPHLTAAQQNNLFWVNAAIGLLLGIAALGLGPVLGLIYDEPDLVAPMQVMGLIFVFNGLATQHRARLTRDLRLGVLASVDGLVPVVGLIIAVGIAAAGGAYWALVAQQVTVAGVSAAAIWLASRWMPRGPNRAGDIRTHVRQGFHLVTAQAVGLLGRNADVLLGGLRLTSSELGYYSRAASVMNVPVSQINPPATRVAVAVLARLQGDIERFNAYLIRGQAHLLHVVAAVLGALIALAHPVVRIVLGPQWSETAPILQILAAGAVLRIMTYGIYWHQLVEGRTGLQLRAAAWSLPAFAIGAWVGSGFGAEGLAWGMGLAGLVSWAISLVIAARHTDAPIGKLLRSGLPIAVTYLVAGIAGAAAWEYGAPHVALPVAVVASGGAFLVIVGIALATWRPFRESARDMWASRRLLLRDG